LPRLLPYQLYWRVGPHHDHSIDTIRAEDAFSSKLGYDEHIPGQTRDWNEELQTPRKLERKNLAERMLRERGIFKVLLLQLLHQPPAPAPLRCTRTLCRPPPAAPWPKSTAT
jgi:hypothetical protein